MVTPGFLIHGIGYPGYGPYLSAMGMAAELEIYAGLLGLLKMIWLMVKQYAESLYAVRQGTQRFALRIGTVITAYNGYAVE